MKTTKINIGDTVEVSSKIQEKDKERQTRFKGVVMAMKGRGQSKTFTVRKIGKGGVGVERIYPLFSPLISKIKIVKEGKVRRSKIYYLRKRTGKAATYVKQTA